MQTVKYSKLGGAIMTCNKCKHFGRCDGIPGDDCFERAPETRREPKTDPCPPPEHITFEGDLTVLQAYAQIKRMIPLLPMSTFGKTTLRRRVLLSGKFETLQRVRAMRGSCG